MTRSESENASSTHRNDATVIGHDGTDAVARMAAELHRIMGGTPQQAVNILAIGSDRTTGDCLGPLVGEYLLAAGLNVYGTLDAPVHAANMIEIVPEITGFTIAVDAALGNPVGGISVRPGPLAPGAAFGRELPPVGNISISGLVCETGPLGFERLRSVRLGFVRRVARTIALGIAAGIGVDLVTPDRPGTPFRDDDLLDLAACESELAAEERPLHP
ncbi:MAG: spore protease YyaC [Acidimicrobiia bacterium]|nr:spore protease YyaC [Acidimicrobiia bacterium]